MLICSVFSEQEELLHVFKVWRTCSYGSAESEEDDEFIEDVSYFITRRDNTSGSAGGVCRVPIQERVERDVVEIFDRLKTKKKKKYGSKPSP